METVKDAGGSAIAEDRSRAKPTNNEKELEAAEVELVEARRELVKAERDIEAAAKKIEEIIDRDRPFKVDVFYNGVPKAFEVRHDELVKTLLDRALAAFGPIPNPHTLLLYKGAEELDDAKTLDQSGVKPNDKLLLRPSTVKGGVE
jgi:hypothetical protein